MDARVATEAGHEVFACAVPPSEQLDGKFLGARLTDGDHNNAISVTASTWPWRQRSKTYGVAVTADAREEFGPLGAGRGETLRRRVQALL